MLLKLSRKLGVSADYLLTGRQQTPLDVAGAIRAGPHISTNAKRHLVGIVNELRSSGRATARCDRPVGSHPPARGWRRSAPLWRR